MFPLKHTLNSLAEFGSCDEVPHMSCSQAAGLHVPKANRTTQDVNFNKDTLNLKCNIIMQFAVSYIYI
jgi:hypothetical protein